MVTEFSPFRPERRRHLQQLGAAGLLTLAPWGKLATAASTRRDAVSLNISQEPESLDPTTNAASSAGQVVLYNILETLIKIDESGALLPLLATAWSNADTDPQQYVFELRQGVRFHDGAAFDASCVIFSFERAKAVGSQNKAHRVFENIRHMQAESPHRLRLTLHNPDPHFLFRLGEATAVILHPDTAAQAATHPIGTGPYTYVSRQKGHSITLHKASTFRAPQNVAIAQASFRFIHDLPTQIQALEMGEVDVFINFITQDLHRFHSNPRYQMLLGTTSGKGLLALNHRHPLLGDVRVRQALTHAIDRQAFISEVLQGKGTVIGSHFAPSDPGFLNLGNLYAYNPERARELLHEAGVRQPVEMRLSTLPVPYAREGAPFIAHYLEQVGIHIKIETVSWAHWMQHTFKGDFDMSLITHVEPLDHMIYAEPDYYFGYDSPAFRDLATRHATSRMPRERQLLYAQLQRHLTDDAVNVWIFSSQISTVARKGLQGLWMNYPIYTHDISALRWAS